MAKLKLSDTWKPYRGPNQTYKIVSCRFGVKLIQPKHKPHRKPRSNFPIYCWPGNFPIKADQHIFRIFANAWKTGAWWYYDGSNPVWTDIDRDAWDAFAASIDYYISPTQTRTITGYQAFLAWQQANLQPDLTRIQRAYIWRPWYPTCQWPSPPAAYNPIITTSVSATYDDGTKKMTYTPTPYPPARNRNFILYTSGAAKKGRYESAWGHIMSFYDFRPWDWPLTENPHDNCWWWGRWRCHGPGYVRPGFQFVDDDTGSPAPVVWGDPIYCA